MKESGVQAVKLEGGERVLPQIRTLVAAGIPVMAHIGLTPQSLHQLGGYRVQGRGDDGALLQESARAVQSAGAFAVVLELIPADLAALITSELTIPTIGIGAGVACDAQVLVWSDLMGLAEKPPKLAKVYRNLRREISEGVNEWARDVATGAFPGPEQSFQ
jgi:3-methyl-2-oxobutanoate hydroxymethyltransferase